jgi:predicted  nucleic acid-binding Zn-ribbon protein
MFGFGVGEAATIAAVLQGLKALNDGLATVKEAGANAGQISSLVSRYSDLDQKIRDVESKSAGVLSVKDSMNLQIAKQQATNFHRALKDSLLMQQGGAAQYKEIMQRIEDSKVAHEREVNRLKIKRRQRQKLLKELGTYAMIGLLCVSFLLGALFIYVELFM